MRYCKFLSTEHGAPVPRYAYVEARGVDTAEREVLWAVSPMEAPEEDLLARSIPILPLNPAPLTDLRLLAPVTPSKILCVGRNYRDHATQLVDALQVGFRTRLDFLGELLHGVGAPQRIDEIGHTALMGDDLLRP